MPIADLGPGDDQAVDQRADRVTRGLIGQDLGIAARADVAGQNGKIGDLVVRAGVQQGLTLGCGTGDVAKGKVGGHGTFKQGRVGRIGRKRLVVPKDRGREVIGGGRLTGRKIGPSLIGCCRKWGFGHPGKGHQAGKCRAKKKAARVRAGRGMDGS